MPRIRQNEDVYAMKDFIDEINAQCGRYGYKSQRALGEAVGVCQATARSYLLDPCNMPLGILRKMIKQLRLDPVVVLRMLGYSGREVRNALETDQNVPA